MSPSWQDPNQPDPYRCAVCGTHYVVRSLARDCEHKHEKEPT